MFIITNIYTIYIICLLSSFIAKTFLSIQRFIIKPTKIKNVTSFQFFKSKLNDINHNSNNKTFQKTLKLENIYFNTSFSNNLFIIFVRHSLINIKR